MRVKKIERILYLPGQYEKENRDPEISGCHVNPNVETQRTQEREEIRWFLDWFSIQNTDSCIRENHLFTHE